MAKRAELHYLRLIPPPPPACRAVAAAPLCTAYHMRRLRRRWRSHSCLEKQRDVGGNCGGGTAVYFVFRRAYSCLIGYLSQSRKKNVKSSYKVWQIIKKHGIYLWIVIIWDISEGQSKKMFKIYCLSSRIIHDIGNLSLFSLSTLILLCSKLFFILQNFDWLLWELFKIWNFCSVWCQGCRQEQGIVATAVFHFLDEHFWPTMWSTGMCF